MAKARTVNGAGLGLRQQMIPELQQQVPAGIHFFEVAPENWLGCGGQSARTLRAFTERYPFVCHGLSLSLGGPAKLDHDLLKRIRRFMQDHDMALYTEHLSWCSDDGQLYDLLPLPHTGEAVRWAADRIGEAQDILGRRIGIENASTYLRPPGGEMTESDFIRAVVEEADCLLHLDVNNLWVNSRNFGFDPREALRDLPLDRTCYIHVAGHDVEADGLCVDTHGAPVIDPVWQLLVDVYRWIGPVPTCLERDTNIPALPDLADEVRTIASLQLNHGLRQQEAM